MNSKNENHMLVRRIDELNAEIKRLREALRNLLFAFQDLCVGLPGDTHEAEAVAMELTGEPHWTDKQRKGIAVLKVKLDDALGLPTHEDVCGILKSKK